MTRVHHGARAEDTEAHAGPAVDVLDETLEQLEPVGERLGQVTRGNPIGLG